MIARTILPVIILQLLACTVLAQGPDGTMRSEHVVLFEKDLALIRPAEQQQLEAFVRTISFQGDHDLDVHGHTDSDGSQAYNEDLALARAEQVAAQLIRLGADPDRVHLSASGERNPVATNKDAAGMTRNRRVTVTHTSHHFRDMNALRKHLATGSVQRFVIDPQADARFTGAAGIEVHIGPGMLMDQRGRPMNGMATVELTEALDLTPMVAHGLNTVSKGRLLETGGMLKLEAFASDGAPLLIRPGGQVEVSVPVDVRMDGMQLFLSDDGADWDATGQELTTKATTVVNDNAAIVLRTMPSRNLSRCRLPVYRADLRGKPYRPAPPSLPKHPRAPRPEDHTVRVPWWKVWARAAATRDGQRRFALAEQRYQERMRRYEQALEQFEADQATYPERLASFMVRRVEWDARQLAAYEEWCTNVRLPVQRICDRINSTENVRNDTLIAQWMQERRDVMANWNMRTDNVLSSVPQSRLQYTFSAMQFGWINCDRFPDVPMARKQPIIAQIDHDEDTELQMVLVFTNLRSVMALYRTAPGQWVTPPVPMGEEAMLVAYAVRDGRTHLFVTDVRPGIATRVELEPSSYKTLVHTLTELGDRDG